MPCGRSVSSVQLEFSMDFFLPLLIHHPRWLLFWCYSKWNYLQLSGCIIEGQWLSRGNSNMSPQCCVLQEDKAGQGVAQQSLTMWWLWKTQNMLMRATTKFSVFMFNVTMFKCTSGAKCQSALDLFIANHRKMKGQCLPKRNHSVSKVQFWPPEHWCRLEKSAWTSSTA